MFGQLFHEVRSIVEERLSRLKKRAAAMAAAVVLLGLAFLFALLGIFIELQKHMGGAMAAFLLFIILAAAGAGALMFGREKKPEAARQLQTTANPVQRTAEVNPLTSSGWPLILTAFAAGIALSRGRLNGWRRDRH
jgi:Kef-type K+ transport system membrane component KefB